MKFSGKMYVTVGTSTGIPHQIAGRHLVGAIRYLLARSHFRFAASLAGETDPKPLNADLGIGCPDLGETSSNFHTHKRTEPTSHSQLHRATKLFDKHLLCIHRDQTEKSCNTPLIFTTLSPSSVSRRFSQSSRAILPKVSPKALETYGIRQLSITPAVRY
jgi:hypothetical protein